MSVKFLGALVAAVSAAVLLVGCSGSIELQVEPLPTPAEEPGTVGDDGEIYTDFVLEEVPFSAPLEGSETFPFVTDVSSSGFVLANGGSSSCPNVIESVVIFEDESRVDVRYEAPSFSGACTDDFQITAVKVSLTDLELMEPDEAVFTLGGEEVRRE